MSNAIALRETDTMAEWGVMREQASMLVTTGFLPQAIKTPEQAVAIILTGRELGIGTMAALNNIAVIQGKPTVSPQLMLALINRTGQVEDLKIETGADGATCTIKRRGRSAYTARFGPKEAQAMGLSGKDNYKKQPATMYKWRAVAEAVRFTFSDVTLGLYTPEEMGAAVNEDGDVWQGPTEVGPPVTPRPILEAATIELREEVMDVIDNALTVAAVRQVVLEGAQPTEPELELPELPGAAGHVVKLAKQLKYGEATLAGLIADNFGTTVTPGNLKDYLEFASKDELRELYRVMNSKGGKR